MARRACAGERRQEDRRAALRLLGRHDPTAVDTEFSGEQLSVSRTIMDSLANYASDGDNSNNSEDAKVSERVDTFAVNVAADVQDASRHSGA